MTKALCTDATCSAVSFTSTDKLRERVCAPFTIWCAEPHRPPGILWEHLDQDKIAEVPALAALAAGRRDTKAIS